MVILRQWQQTPWRPGPAQPAHITDEPSLMGMESQSYDGFDGLHSRPVSRISCDTMVGLALP